MMILSDESPIRLNILEDPNTCKDNCELDTPYPYREEIQW